MHTLDAFPRRYWILFPAAFLLLFLSCESEDGTLAPYAERENVMSTIVIQDSTFAPKITWVGGYSCVLGVNRGSRAVLDSSLVWLVKAQGNTLRYPVLFGQLPQGAQELSGTYGGRPITKLKEDDIYTYWIIKEDAWSLVSAQRGKVMVADAAATGIVLARNDSLFIQAASYTQARDTIDIYVNLKDPDPRGRLADIMIEETDSSNNPLVRFQIKQDGISDTLVAAVGLVVNSALYDVNNVLWEVLSKETVGGQPAYRTKNVISSPLFMGQTLSQTQVFISYPAAGLERNKLYYFWIATKDWDGISRDTRTVNHYAWITFRTW